MEAGFIVLLISVAIICLFAGICIEKARTKRRDVQGILNVDCNDLDSGPGLFLALEVPIAEVTSRKHVTFRVNVMR